MLYGVAYHIYLVSTDDEYIADLLNYFKQFWDSTQDRNGTAPLWQKDALNLNNRADQISKNCTCCHLAVHLDMRVFLSTNMSTYF